MSPEVLSDKPYGYEIDMWAFGVTFYFLLNQELPFSKQYLIQNFMLMLMTPKTGKFYLNKPKISAIINQFKNPKRDC